MANEALAALPSELIHRVQDLPQWEGPGAPIFITDVDGTLFPAKYDMGDWLFEYLLATGKLPESEQARRTASMWERFNGSDLRERPDPRTMYAWHVRAMAGLRAAEVQELVDRRFRDIRLWGPMLALLREVAQRGYRIAEVTADNAFVARTVKDELWRHGIPVAYVRAMPVPVDQRGVITSGVGPVDCPCGEGKVSALESIAREQRRASADEPLFFAGAGDGATDRRKLEWIEDHAAAHQTGAKRMLRQAGQASAHRLTGPLATPGAVLEVGWSVLVNAGGRLSEWAAQRPKIRHLVSLGRLDTVRPLARSSQVHPVRFPHRAGRN